MFSKKWIKNNIKRKIKKKQILHNIYVKSKTELDLYNYKSFKNKLTRIIKCSKQNYINKQIIT